MSSNKRKLTYSLAINEALHQMMERDASVYLIGQGVKSPWYVGNTAQGLLKKYGPSRVIDTPISENAITGAAVGSAMAGMRAVVVHPRMDFMMYALDPIINEASNWHYMNGGRASVPVVIWGVVNRGGEQAAQHSQTLHALFAHFPGLKIVMPSTPYDAKGLLIASIMDDNPVIFVDDRWLYNLEEDVPEEFYSVPIGKGIIRKIGQDITIAATSHMVQESLKAAALLEKEGMSVEIIDLRTAKPLDETLIYDSVHKTGRLIIADGGWKTCGLASEVSALVSENVFNDLKSPVFRITLPDIPAPASRVLEDVYYPTSANIVKAAKKLVQRY
jgi:pyruvate/2-oxoglutarate/acetoin dehydrogenase E1 component